MGDRASVRFKNGDEVSVVYCEHWGGQGLHERARAWAAALPKPDGVLMPLDRREPGHVMAAFIGAECHGMGGYLAADRMGVDDSDNGCLVIDFSVEERGPRSRVEQ